MPKVNNPNPGTVHSHIARLGKSVDVPPGVSELSEEDLAMFGKELLAGGIEVLESLNDVAEEKKEPVKVKKEDKKLESLNDSAEKKSAAAPKNEEKLEKINE